MAARIPVLDDESADAEQRELLDATRRQLGRTPNLYAAMANSPATLRGYLALRESLGQGALGDVDRERLALLVAEVNGCDYCVAAHTMRGGRLGLSAEELRATRDARADDPHARALLEVARSVLATGGRVEDDLVVSARERGVTDEELTEVVGHVALNVLSNFFNHLARPALDFPPVGPVGTSAA